MSKEILEKLFDSPVKVKLLKLFLRNPDQFFTLSEVRKRTKSDLSTCRSQIAKLESIKLIKSRIKSKKKEYAVNSNFDFYKELRTLVLKSSPASKKKILRRIRGLGKINLAVLSGVFMNTDIARVDLLIVGDGIKNKKLSSFFKDLEAEIGKEIDYVVLSTKDFKYRFDMFDRFIRDVLEKPHEKLINKLRI
ncbi:MAG: hypothetical protein ISS02_00125 [Candidatus Portnoybacteria bacterium]|nr:hypothetical protein [Candidatus Portnoybacteria bacterium]